VTVSCPQLHEALRVAISAPVDQLDGIAGEVKHPRARPRHTAGMKLSRSEPVVRRRRVVGGYRFAS
jgi:hypothetical protein